MRITDETIDVYSKEFQQSIYRYYEELRKKGKVVYVAKSDCWIVLGYDEVKQVLEDNINFSSEQLKNVDTVLLGADNQQHAANKKSTVQNMSALHGASTSQLNDCADEVFTLLLSNAKKNASNNLVDELINPYTFFLSLKALGINDIPEPLNIFTNTSSFPEKIKNINALFTNWDALLPMINDNLTTGAGDEMQKLIAEIKTVNNYEQHELAGFIKLLILAGTETTASLIASSVYFILSDGFSEEIKKDETIIPKFINEVLRINSPAQFTFRKTANKVLLGGNEIPENSVIAVAVGAANRDPLIFERPVEFDMNRKAKHIAFGTGSHRCIGEHLAMYVAKSFIQKFIPLTDEIKYNGVMDLNNSLFTFKISKIETRFTSEQKPLSP